MRASQEDRWKQAIKDNELRRRQVHAVQVLRAGHHQQAQNGVTYHGCHVAQAPGR